MKKRVLILSTSPRQGSNSDALAASFPMGEALPALENTSDKEGND